MEKPHSTKKQEIRSLRNDLLLQSSFVFRTLLRLRSLFLVCSLLAPYEENPSTFEEHSQPQKVR